MTAVTNAYERKEQCSSNLKLSVIDGEEGEEEPAVQTKNLPSSEKPNVKGIKW